MNMLKREIATLSSLEDHWRVPILLENQCPFQDLQEFGPRVKVPPQSTTGNEIRAIHHDLPPLDSFQILLMKDGACHRRRRLSQGWASKQARGDCYCQG
jgi:hypothetical protein